MTDMRSNHVTLFDAKYGRPVGHVDGDEVVSRWGHRYRVEGYAVVNGDEVVGTYDDGNFWNTGGELMAVTERPAQ